MFKTFLTLFPARLVVFTSGMLKIIFSFTFTPGSGALTAYRTVAAVVVSPVNSDRSLKLTNSIQYRGEECMEQYVHYPVHCKSAMINNSW
jgi:hypothetical protein